MSKAKKEKMDQIFFVNYLAGKSVLATSLFMSPILYFLEMSGFEPRELPCQAGTNLATHLPA
jgi:hypothetical protein